jgi:YNFM family putative membrane transporter
MPSTLAANDDAAAAPKTQRSTLNKLPYIERGTPQFMRVTLALFSAGLATFALLYCVQPILPVLSQDFGISPAESSLSLSVSTGLLALGLMFTGPLSDAIGRKPVMVVALLLAAICTLICAFMTSWQGILLMRALIGLSLSGVAAVGMTYLSEEIHPSFVAFSMGLYISGNSIGGMSGRLVTGVLTDFFSWRVSLAVIGLFALAAACMFWRILPASKHFRASSLRPRTLLINFRLHWHDKGLPLLFAEGFLLMGSFVTMFNYIGYRLLADPYHLSQAIVGLLSVVYLTGSYSSPKAGAMTSPLRPRASVIGFDPDYADRDTDYCPGPGRGDFYRHDAVHRRFLCRPFGCQQLDRTSRPPRQRTSILALFILLLRWLQRRRDPSAVFSGTASVGMASWHLLA